MLYREQVMRLGALYSPRSAIFSKTRKSADENRDEYPEAATGIYENHLIFLKKSMIKIK